MPLQTAATIVRSSPNRKQLLIGLDSAAFAAFVAGAKPDAERLLSIGASPILIRPGGTNSGIRRVGLTEVAVETD